MQTVVDNQQPEENPGTIALEENAKPRPKIDPADALTLLPRLFAGFFLGGLSVLYIITQQWGMVAFLAIASGLMIFWAYRLITKMRNANVEYIAYRAQEEKQERERKAAARS